MGGVLEGWPPPEKACWSTLQGGPGWGQQALLTLVEQSTSGYLALCGARPLVWPPWEMGTHPPKVAGIEKSKWLHSQSERPRAVLLEN